jgi:transposase InsO family protein
MGAVLERSTAPRIVDVRSQGDVCRIDPEPERSSSTAFVNEEEEAKAEALWTARGEPRIYSVHAFAHACEQNGIEHRLTKPRHPWTNGQVERMNRTLKEART